MKVKNLYAIGLCLLLFTPLSWGLSQSRIKPFQQYIDHFQFTKLSTEEQKTYLIAIMETLAEMEQEVIDADKIYTNDHAKRSLLKQKKKALFQIKQILEQLSSQVGAPSAYASAPNPYCPAETIRAITGKHARTSDQSLVTCMYGTYMSNMVRDGSSYYCVRPSCSANQEFAEAHNSAATAAGCSPAQMVCNPNIYGKNTVTNRSSCVTLDFQPTPGEFTNIAHNVSLACLMEVTNDQNSDARLAAIASSIVNAPEAEKESVANNFNRMLSIITNVCLCGDVGFNGRSLDSYEATFDPSYVQYLNGHRSCNALLSQMQLLTGKISENRNYCTENTFLPPNLGSFSRTLADFATYSNRVSNYMQARDENWSASNPRHRAAAMRQLRERWIVTDTTGLSGSSQQVSEDQALDNIINQSSLNAWKERICPLRIDPPAEEASCSLSIISRERTNPTTLALSASAQVRDAAGEDAEATLEWSMNDEVISGQVSNQLSSSLTIDPSVSQFSLSARATIGSQTLDCPAIAIDLPEADDSQNPACELASNTAVMTREEENFTFTLPTHTTTPEDLAGSLVWYNGETVFTGNTIPATEEMTSLTLNAKYNRDEGEPLDCGNVVLSPGEPEPEPEDDEEGEAEECTLSATHSPAETPGLFTVEASVTPAPDEGESVTFSGMSELRPVEGKADTARGNIAGIAQAQAKTISAAYVSDGKNYSCQTPVNIPAAQGQAPAAQPQQPFIPPSEPGFLIQKRGVN